MDRRSDCAPHQASASTARMHGSSSPSAAGLHGGSPDCLCAHSADGDRGQAVSDDFSRSVVPQKYVQGTNR